MSASNKPTTRPRTKRGSSAVEPVKPTRRTTSSKEKQSLVDSTNDSVMMTDKVVFKPGKWRKSLILLRASTSRRDGSRSIGGIAGGGRRISMLTSDSRVSRIILDITVCDSSHTLDARESVHHSLDQLDVSVQQFVAPLIPLRTFADHCYLGLRSPKEEILKRCHQQEPISFEAAFARLGITVRKKIGEGVYGEVFECQKGSNGQRSVLKLIPIEGTLMINGEKQKTFEEIVSEIIISSELSNLRQRSVQFSTDGFVELISVSCVKGEYPRLLLDLWNGYADEQGTENDSPDMFPADQHYIAFETAFGGSDLEGYRFRNALQAFAVFSQIVLCLAIAEQRFDFEHRDLHSGNILVEPTKDTERTYNLLGEEIVIQTQGLKATIIDYTLSRIVYNGLCLFNDLSTDEELFTAEGDYQFEIYRKMKTAVENQWNRHQPKTNVFWLHYLLEKLIACRNYRDKMTKVHRTTMKSMKDLSAILLDFESVHEIVQHYFSSGEDDSNKEN
ncbi:putative serine/threonine-protein kinase haspin homolog [Anopheles albimanus]|uniref:putative serine/threonine-protein kinase haspin homolog n=1 Tax=Anopheles albimanus TaxID=7167 RepID=UPI0016407913|nr:putative serine/threonine-protein kinase haspin homolog [Anopheles albimanus]